MTRIRPGAPVVVGDVEIQPFERVTVHAEPVPGGVAGFACKRPAFLVIRSPAGTSRVDLDDCEEETWLEE